MPDVSKWVAHTSMANSNDEPLVSNSCICAPICFLNHERPAPVDSPRRRLAHDKGHIRPLQPDRRTESRREMPTARLAWAVQVEPTRVTTVSARRRGGPPPGMHVAVVCICMFF